MANVTPIFTGVVTEEGKVRLEDQPSFDNYKRSLAGKRIHLTLQKEVRRRSHQQNAWYWGVAVKLISEHTGHTKEEVHAALKLAFSPKVMVGNLVAPKSTRTLDTVDFGENMMERVVAWAAEVLQVNIPLPEEAEANN